MATADELGERFWSKVEKTDGCWLWTAGQNGVGYGTFALGPFVKGRGRMKLAHRLSYEAINGPIPDGLVIDHLCRNPQCVNPDHLEAVPTRVNLIRGVGFAGTNARKTACVNGHPFDEANTYWRRDGKRQCKRCVIDRARRTRQAERAAHP